jgi:DNA invertase Pin-like site-specific DNA recombinase
MTNAYSYVRFSTARQGLTGKDSLRRQLERTAEYCRIHGLTLDDSLRDVGSGFHGNQSALERFKDRVVKGEIPAGSVLVVEALDRLSRQKPRIAQEQLLSIVNAGVVVVTLIDGQTYSADTLDTNMYQLFTSVGIMIGANAESANKSDRARINFEKLRGTNKVRGRDWLAKSADGGWTPIPERVAYVEFAYQSALTAGVDPIIRKSNAEGLGWKKWDNPSLQKLLRTRAVLGYQSVGKMVNNKRVVIGELKVYPQIISDDLWHRVQAALDARKNGPSMGRNVAEMPNLFGRLARCGECGGKMKVFSRGTVQNGKYRYFGCVDAYYGAGCGNRKLHRTSGVEARMSLIFGGMIEGKLEPDQTDNRGVLLAAAKASVERLARRYGAAFDAFGDAPTGLAQANLSRLEQEHTAAVADLAKLERDHAAIAKAKPEAPVRVRQWFDGLEGLTGQALATARVTIANALPTYIKAVRFAADGTFDIVPAGNYEFVPGVLSGFKKHEGREVALIEVSREAILQALHDLKRRPA